MKRVMASLMVVLVATLSLGGSALAQVTVEAHLPSFQRGVKAIAERIPQEVGEPYENEHCGADGLCLQRTNKGTLVWRKADNWTAFTNGTRTWVNGPFGLQERANGERFDWEMAILPPPVADVGAEALRDQVVSLKNDVEFLRDRVKRQDDMLAAKDETIAELTKRIPPPADDKPWWDFWRGWKLW